MSKEGKIQQKADRAKRMAYIPPSVKRGLEKGKSYKNYFSNKRLRRENPLVRKIKNGKVTLKWNSRPLPQEDNIAAE